MDDQRPITLDLDDAERAQLADLAAQEERTAEELASDAVRARLARHRSYLRAIDEGLDAATACQTRSDDDVQARFRALRDDYLAGRGR